MNKFNDAYFTSSCSWICPEGAERVLVIGCGGGGGGAGNANGDGGPGGMGGSGYLRLIW
jgi:hypothetical protein